MLPRCMHTLNCAQKQVLKVEKIVALVAWRLQVSLTRKATRTVTRPPMILKKHVAAPVTPRQLGPTGSVARAFPARVMLAAATPEQILNPMYHQSVGAAAAATPDSPARVADSPSTFFRPA